MTSKAFLAIGSAAAGFTLLAWPAPREEKPGGAIRIVSGGGPPSPTAPRGWTQPAVVVADVSGPSPPRGTYAAARYAWERSETAADGAPGDPGIWATPAKFAPPE